MQENSNNEIHHMQVRLFHRKWKKWGITQQRCSEIFDSCKLDDYIADMYEFYHVQGDEANISDLEEHIRSIGANYDH